MQFVFDDKMINYQRILNLLDFSQLIKTLLFYNPYKMCKHSLFCIDFIASLYELFDNHSYKLSKQKESRKIKIMSRHA